MLTTTHAAPHGDLRYGDEYEIESGWARRLIATGQAEPAAPERATVKRGGVRAETTATRPAAERRAK